MDRKDRHEERESASPRKTRLGNALAEKNIALLTLGNDPSRQNHRFPTLGNRSARKNHPFPALGFRISHQKRPIRALEKAFLIGNDESNGWKPFGGQKPLVLNSWKWKILKYPDSKSWKWVGGKIPSVSMSQNSPI